MIRQQLEQHWARESCAEGHTRIDPAGFALEVFAVLGGARDWYGALVALATAPQAGLGRGGRSLLQTVVQSRLFRHQ
jgi:hypothetical protein